MVKRGGGGEIEHCEKKIGSSATWHGMVLWECYLLVDTVLYSILDMI